MLQPKLADVGTSIFAVMTAMAIKHDADNLAQGFPEFDPDPWLKDRVNHYIQAGANQYAQMPGTPQLRARIEEKLKYFYQVNRSAENEITVTSGATEAIFAVIQAVVKPGDEAIMFDPSYDSYDPAVRLAGGKSIRLPISDKTLSIDWELTRKAFSDKTRLIIINSPHNPLATVLTEEDLDELADIVRGTDCLILSDEVYEHIIFDEISHASVLKHPELAKRSFVISSFGKTYHSTGWKIGYCVAPPELTTALRQIHQFLTFSTSTPMQLAIADMMHEQPDYPKELAEFYQNKRDLFADSVKASRFKIVPCHGTYFQLLDYSEISDYDDMTFTAWMTQNVGVATIPISPFCATPPARKLIRCCFAKNDETLKSVGNRLSNL